MIRYIARRLASSAVMILLVSLVIVTVLRVLPGDPTISRFGQVDNVSPEAIEAMRQEIGLDDPIPVQYGRWLWGMLRGDFGTSYFSGIPVTELIGQRVAPTVQLAVGGVLVAVVIALVLAVLPVATRRRALGVLVDGFTVYGLSAPVFITAIGLIVVLSMWWGWLPATGYVDPVADPAQGIVHLVIPSLALGMAMAAPLIRYLQGSMEEVIKSTYVRTSLGKGLSWAASVRRHVLPNALLPALTSLGVSIGSLLGGVVVVETVFAWPGLGQQVVDAVMKRDYPVIQATVLLAAVAYVLTTLVVDIVYGVLDPRLRVSTSRAKAEVEEIVS